MRLALHLMQVSLTVAASPRRMRCAAYNSLAVALALFTWAASSEPQCCMPVSCACSRCERRLEKKLSPTCMRAATGRQVTCSQHRSAGFQRQEENESAVRWVGLTTQGELQSMKPAAMELAAAEVVWGWLGAQRASNHGSQLA